MLGVSIDTMREMGIQGTARASPLPPRVLSDHRIACLICASLAPLLAGELGEDGAEEMSPALCLSDCAYGIHAIPTVRLSVPKWWEQERGGR